MLNPDVPAGAGSGTGPQPAPAKVTVPAIRGRKCHRGDPSVVMVTAYDTPGAKIADAAGVDVLLVGDSVANVVLGYENTLQVTVADMVHHTGAVARAKTRALVVADMPWLSYHVSVEDTVRNAAALIHAGAEAVKLEGGRIRLPMIQALISAEIPVMGHLGLTPQSIHAMGGHRVQAKEDHAARALLVDADALTGAGCFAIVLEGIPDVVAASVTEAVSIPTIGIGAGPACDGQVLVFHDLLGMREGKGPKFVRRYTDLGGAATAALAAFVIDVRNGSFPSDDETYHLPRA